MKTATRFLAAAILALGTILALAPATYAIEFEVEIENFAFAPHGLHINVGDMITWRNRDDIGHSSTSDTGIWNSGTLLRDQTFSFIFTSAGTFPYHCTPHSFMKDTIFVNTLSGVDESENSLPGEFNISQNYPNPFNAQTVIKYFIPASAHVSVDIYNVVGQKVATLQDGIMAAGVHEINWDASSTNSGVYFYRVNADNQTKTGRMVLLK